MYASDITKQRNARTLYTSFIKNQQSLAANSTVRSLHFLESDLMTVDEGVLYTTPQEQQAVLYRAPSLYQPLLSGNKVVTGSTAGLTQINFTGIYDSGYGTQAPIPGVLDDAFIPIPLGGNTFTFFGTAYNTITWDSNNAMVFGSGFSPHNVSISATTIPAILLGNYDRMCSGLFYGNTATSLATVTTVVVNFFNYYTDSSGSYTYQIRLIREKTAPNRQYVEVCVVTSPPSTGYDSSGMVYPSGVDGNGRPIDSDGNTIDPTKVSPYNITNGSTFLNPCGTTFARTSPAAGTSFVLSSDATGSSWVFSANTYVGL